MTDEDKRFVGATEPIEMKPNKRSEGRTAAIIVAVVQCAIVVVGVVLMLIDHA